MGTPGAGTSGTKGGDTTTAAGVPGAIAAAASTSASAGSSAQTQDDARGQKEGTRDYAGSRTAAGAGSGAANAQGETAGGSINTSSAIDLASSSDTAMQTQQSPATRAVTSPALRETTTRQSVSLQEAADAVRATFTAANQAGVSTARLSLSPAELGGIRVNLTQTANGLLATVVADHPEAAQTLQRHADDLRQSLQENGMPLLKLDIGTAGDQHLSGSGSSGDQLSKGNARGGQTATAPTNSSDEMTQSTTTLMTITLSSGSLIDVMA